MSSPDLAAEEQPLLHELTGDTMRIALLALLCCLSLPALANPYATMSAP